MIETSATALVAELEAVVGARYVLRDTADVEPYFMDWIGRNSGEALCVVRPGSAQEVAEIVRICAYHGEPVFPQGGNTGVVTGSIPLKGGHGVLLSLSRLKAIRALDKPNNSMTVEAGLTLAEVQSTAASIDRLFPLSLSAEGTCQIGGNVSTNAGGTGVLRYGNARDLVLGLEVVLADGTVWNGLKTLRKDNTGYDLKNLFIGSEGTLGIVTAVSLKLFPRPRQLAGAWIGVPDVSAAGGLLATFQERFDAALTTFELISGPQAAIIYAHVPDARSPLPDYHPWIVFAELSSPLSSADLEAELTTALAEAAEAGLVRDAAIAQSERQARDFWRIRHGVSEANRRQGLNFTHDVAVPISRIGDFLAQADAETTRRFAGAEVYVVSHMGDGNVHYTVTFQPDRVAELAPGIDLGARVTEMIHDLAVACGGSFGAEHGIGQRYRASLKRYKSSIELAMFRQLKQALDPAGVLNPGKVLPES
jgi:FAD/FMN-containing dehydrogenase